MIAELNHIAIIPDGNRRWAQARGFSRIEGHRKGAERMRETVDWFIKVGLKYLTLWGFSTDNWKRDEVEVQDIFELLDWWIRKDTPWLHENDVRIKHIGRIYELPPVLQESIKQAVNLTSDNKGLTLNVAFNYSGRAEIVDAVNQLIEKGIPSVDEKYLSHYLYTDGSPDVDLVIRTAGEFRVSNFMLWQTAYAEYYFTPVFWPDFDKQELKKALEVYESRVRRYGGD